MIEAQNRRLAEEMGLRDDGYWWCSLCLAEKSPQQVTYEENCTTCGRPIEWIDGPDFTSDSGFVLALAYAQDDARHEWTWQELCDWMWEHSGYTLVEGADLWIDTIPKEYLSPATFAPTLLAFIDQWKEARHD